jgi:hypothetical protein
MDGEDIDLTHLSDVHAPMVELDIVLAPRKGAPHEIRDEIEQLTTTHPVVTWRTTSSRGRESSSLARFMGRFIRLNTLAKFTLNDPQRRTE